MLKDSRKRVLRDSSKPDLAIRRGYWKLLTTLLFVAGSLGLQAPVVSGQTYLQSLGVPPFTTSIPVESGIVNVPIGNLHLEIPIASYPERGNRQFKAMLTYDSAIWYPDIGTGTWQPWAANGNIGSGWSIVSTGIGNTINMTFDYSTYCYTTMKYWIYYDSNGTQHPFGIQTQSPLYGCSGGTSSASGYAVDGSGYFLSVTGYYYGVVISPNGDIVSSPSFYPTSLSNIPKDVNGNYFSTTYYTDPVGRIPLDGSFPYPYTYQYLTIPNAEGTSSSTYTITLESINVCTDFGTSDSGIDDFCDPDQQLAVVQSIELPDGTSYSFTYDNGTTIGTSGNYGLVKSMTLPTGETINYTYHNITDAYGNIARWIYQKSNSEGTWSFSSPSIISSCSSGEVNCQQSVTATMPSGDYNVYTSTLNGGAWTTEIDTHDYTSSSVLSSTTACYDALNPGNCTYAPTSATPAINVYRTSQTTTLPVSSGSVSTTTQYAWDSSNDGNLTQIKEWNFGSSTTGAADRTTSISYLGGSSYTSANIVNRPSSVTVTNASSAPVKQTNYSYDGSSLVSATGKINHDDTYYGTGNNVRGNLTQVQQWVGGSTYLSTSMTYDMLGNVISMTDSNGDTTSLSYTDNFYNDAGNGTSPSSYSPSTATNAYPTNITLPSVNSIMPTLTLGYYYTGQMALSTDFNGNATMSHFYDLLNRPTSVSYPDGGWNLTTYGSSDTQIDNYTAITSTGVSSGCTSCRHDQTVLNSLGQTSYQNLVNDSGGEDYVNITYDPDGRPYVVSNAYRSTSDPTYGTTTFAYDGLNRATSVTRPDSSIAYTYFGAAVSSHGGVSSLCSITGYPILSIDEAGNKRQTWMDAFGRMIETDEPNSSGSLAVGTCYNYDANNNLTQVLQNSSRTRTFYYDDLSRLTQTSTPENGTTYYYYTNSSSGLCSGDPSEVCRRTDARGITTTYSYDALNRLTQKSYSGGGTATPTASYGYDNPSAWGRSLTNTYGRMVTASTSDGNGEIFSYDTMGRLVRDEQCVYVGLSGCVTATADYDLDGSTKDFTNASGTTLSYAYDNAQNLSSLTSSLSDSNHPGTLFSSPQYTAFGALLQDSLGNGIADHFGYTNRTWINSYWACQVPGSSCSSSDLVYTFNMTPTSGPGYTANGNVLYGADWVNGNWNYTYDTLNRLSTASCGGSCPGSQSSLGFSFSYDAWGNRTAQTVTAGTGGSWSAGYTSSNQISSGFTYDYAGNVTGDGTHTNYFDAENRLVQVDGTLGTCSSATACYTYDGLGRRVSKATSSGAVDYFYDIQSRQSVVMDSTGTQIRAEIYAATRHLGTYTNGTTYFSHDDWLGTERVRTNASGGVDEVCQNAPYGDMLSCTSTDRTPFHYTGYERDPETDPGNGTGNDYAMARYYGSRMGRFFSPDPLGILSADLSSPQSLNLYAYVYNNPVNLTDPTGMDPCAGGGSECSYPCDSDPDSCQGGGGGCDIFEPCGGGGNIPNMTPLPPAAPPYIHDPLSGETNGIPSGMQFPVMGGVGFPGSGCTYGAGACGGGVYGFISCASGGCPTFPTQIDYLNWLLLLLGPNAFIDQRILPPGMTPNVPPNSSSCSRYHDGTSAGAGLYNICMSTVPPMGDNYWANCSRGTLLQEYVPNGTNKQLRQYLEDHPRVWAACTVPTAQ